MKIRRLILGVAMVVGVVCATLVSNQVAQAAPANCAGPDAPPACHHGPPPPPAPPATLESAHFNPGSGPLVFTLIVSDVPDSALIGVSEGSTTQYHIYLNCSNGFFRAVHLKLFRRSSDNNVLMTDDINANAGEAAGTCYATTWDQVAFHATTSSYGFFHWDSEDKTSWTVEFD